jgi:hypothetical protein
MKPWQRDYFVRDQMIVRRRVDGAWLYASLSMLWRRHGRVEGP